MTGAGRNKPPRVLFAWEMGDNFGHATMIVEVAKALAGRAHVSVAARNPKAFQPFLKGLDLDLGPAPFRAYARPTDTKDLALASSDNLAFMGWGEVETLSSMVSDWQSVFARTSPDLLVAKAAPTALLAARGSGLPTALIGFGFDLPPRSNPMPMFSHWRAENLHLRDALTEREGRILARANQVLAAKNQPPLSCLSDVFRADREYLVTIPDIDHYAPRALFEADHPPYLGAIFTSDQGVEKFWPEPRRGKRILAYLKPSAPFAEEVFAALAAMAQDHDVMLAAPGISARGARNLSAAGVDVIDGPLKLEGVLPAADLGVSHASNGMSAAFLLAGVAQIGLPMQAEQAMIANAMTKGKFGQGLFGQITRERATECMTHILNTPEYTDIAKARAQEIRRDPNLMDPAKTIAKGLLDFLSC